MTIDHFWFLFRALILLSSFGLLVVAAALVAWLAQYLRSRPSAPRADLRVDSRQAVTGGAHAH